MMSHFVGKIDLNALVGTNIMEIEHDGNIEKGVFIPIVPNGIVQWKNEMQLWFRAFSYRSPKSRFSHFIMKFIPRSSIKKLSASQIELFATRSIGGMMRSDSNIPAIGSEPDTEDFITKNI